MDSPPDILESAAKVVGWLLVHSLWQGACAALVLALSLVFCRHRSAALRHVLCLAALLTMVVATACTAWTLHNIAGTRDLPPKIPKSSGTELPAFAADRSDTTASVPRLSPAGALPVAPAFSPATGGRTYNMGQLEALFPWLAAGWIGGVALLSIRHLGGWYQVGELRRSGTPVESALQDAFERVARAFGISSTARVLQSATAATPMLTGVAKPIVLLPARLVTGLPSPELEALIAHELAHLARGDTWTNLAQIAVETLFFYHPAAWWIAHRSRREREHAADDLALSVCRDRRTYADALARLAELQLPADAALAATGGDLLTRIRRIVAPAQREREISGWNIGAPALLAAFVLTAVLAGHAADDGVISVDPGESIQKVIDNAPVGSIVRLQPGDYKERVIITKPLTLEGAGADQTRITVEEPDAKEIGAMQPELQKRFNTASTPEERRAVAHDWITQVVRPAITVRDTEGVTVRNLRLQGVSKRGPNDGGTSSVLLHFSRAKGSVNDCAVVGPFGNGIHIVDGSDVSIARTLVAAFWGEGVVAFGRARNDPSVVPSRVHLADSEVRSVYHYGVQLGNGCDSSIIERCRISGTAWHGIRYDDASPTITGNTIYMHARSGIYASGTTRATIRGNLFWKNEMNGISCWTSNEDNIEGNTFVENQREAIAVLGGSKPQITRNIFTQNPIAIMCGMIANRGQNSPVGAPILNGNLFHENLVAVQVGQEKRPAPEGSLVVDPDFTDPGQQKFSLAPNSAARTGNVGVTEPLAPVVGAQTLLSEEKSIVPSDASRDFKLWGAPGAPKVTPSAEQHEMKARKEAEFWLADAFQLDDKAKRETAIERIRATMSSDKPDEVRAGVIAFVQLGPVEFDKASFRPIVRKLLSSPDVTTRKASAEAFAITGAEPEDLQRIYALAGDPAAEVRSGLTHVIVQLTNNDLTSPDATAAIGKLMDSLPRDPRDVAHALWCAKLSPQLESRVLEYCRDISGSGPGYDFFYGALSTQANKSEAGVKRLIEILADPDVTNRAGRAAWGLQQGVAREQYPLVADAMLKLIEARSEGHLRNEALTCLGNYGDSSHIAKLEALLAKPGVTGEFRKKLEVILATLRSRPAP